MTDLMSLVGLVNSSNKVYTLPNNADLYNPVAAPVFYINCWQGLIKLYSTARKNWAVNSEDFSRPTKVKGGSGATAVVNTLISASPSGTITACKLTFDIGAGTTSGDFCGLNSATFTSTGTSQRLSIWLKCGAGSTYTVEINTKGLYPTLCVVTPTWQKFKLNGACTGATTYAGIQLRGNGGTSKSCVIYAWGWDFRINGDDDDRYISTGSSATTITDYTYVSATGVMTLATAPLTYANGNNPEVVGWTGSTLDRQY